MPCDVDVDVTKIDSWNPLRYAAGKENWDLLVEEHLWVDRVALFKEVE